MFGLIPRRAARKAAGDGGALMAPFAFPMFRGTLLPEFDRLFDRFAREVELPLEGYKAWRWDVDLEDKSEEVVVRAEAPGFKPEDFEIEVRDEMLILHAVKEVKPALKDKEEKKDKEVKEYAREEFYEAVSLPHPVKVDKVEAKYVNGVLTVTLPKMEDAKGRRVPVTTT